MNITDKLLAELLIVDKLDIMTDSMDMERSDYFRQLFIEHGTLRIPLEQERDNYRLSFSFKDKKLADDTIEFLNAAGLKFKMQQLADNYYIFMGTAKNIEKFVRFLGAAECADYIKETYENGQVRAGINRITNFAMSNIQKTANAVAVLESNLQKIVETKGDGFLSEDMIETAKIRIENPELSLQEIADMLELSKGAVNCRLRKINEIAKKIDEEPKDE